MSNHSPGLNIIPSIFRPPNLRAFVLQQKRKLEITVGLFILLICLEKGIWKTERKEINKLRWALSRPNDFFSDLICFCKTYNVQMVSVCPPSYQPMILQDSNNGEEVYQVYFLYKSAIG